MRRGPSRRACSRPGCSSTLPVDEVVPVVAAGPGRLDRDAAAVAGDPDDVGPPRRRLVERLEAEEVVGVVVAADEQHGLADEHDDDEGPHRDARGAATLVIVSCAPWSTPCSVTHGARPAAPRRRRRLACDGGRAADDATPDRQPPCRPRRPTAASSRCSWSSSSRSGSSARWPTRWPRPSSPTTRWCSSRSNRATATCCSPPAGSTSCRTWCSPPSGASPATPSTSRSVASTAIVRSAGWRTRPAARGAEFVRFAERGLPPVLEGSRCSCSPD